jgi:oxygen-dependent protoporphyrinogen oxidase
MEIVVVGGGISGLASAFCIEQEAERRGEKVNVCLLEGDTRLGGKIDSRHVDGFVIEGGVNGWLDSKPSTDALCRDLGIAGERLVSNDAARKRFIWHHGRLRRLPESPLAFLMSGLLSWRGKLRLAREPWAAEPPADADADETLADFARRRLGREALEVLLDPMVSGIFAGDPERMSLRSSFPRIAEIERQHGSLVRGLVRIQRQRQKERKRALDAGLPAGNSAGDGPRAGPAGPGGRLISFADGTSRLIEALGARLGCAPQTGRRVTRIERVGGGYTLGLADGARVQAERVVVATPSWAAARMLDDLDAELARELLEIPYAAVAVVALAWKQNEVGDLGGFGFLVPHGEGRTILGTLWDSSVFSRRAPDGYALTRTMVGGMRRGNLALRQESEIVEAVREELRHILGVTAHPHLTHVVVHKWAIPQYVSGHAHRLARIRSRLTGLPGLFITGNAYEGVGLNDCTREAGRIAERVLD